MSESCWVVVGSAGENTDQEAWVAGAFACEADANAFAAMLNEKLRAAGLLYERGERVKGHCYPQPFELPEDPHFTTDRTGTIYTVAEVSSTPVPKELCPLPQGPRADRDRGDQ